MNRALFAGLSGTMNNQIRLDVIGNNLANSGTIGYKSSRASFQDAFYQTLSNGAPATENSGGQNPVQVGSGNGLGTIQTLHTQGSLESTGQPLDCAVEGEGMFILSSGGSEVYTRDGLFTLDDTNTLVSASSGMRVQGWMKENGAINTTAAAGDMQFTLGGLADAQATESVSMDGNLSSAASVGDSVVTSIQVYDSLGASHNLEVTMTRAGANSYDIEVACEGDTASATLSFDGDGKLTAGSPVALSFAPGGGATGPQVVSVDFSGVTQLANASDATAVRQDGSPPASLVEVSMQAGGLIQGTYSDGHQTTLGQIALASFANVRGLERIGNNLYGASGAAGHIDIGPSNTGGRGKIVAQSLEHSNVDMTEAFVDMISTQRAFQASTRVISNADELLEEVMRLAR